MNWVSNTSWLWKALRGGSVTFAALFALSLLGLSVMRGLRHLLGEFGVPWLALLILPVLVIGAIAKRERQWMPDDNRRKRWSRWLVFGSIGISVLLAMISHDREPRPSAEPSSSNSTTRMHGPSGK